MELYSESIENAVASWAVVQGLPDYKTLVGELLFREIFNISPGAINMFGFGEGVDCYHMPETLFKLPAFQAHTNAVVTMLETALVMMLGNDTKSLAVALSELGSKHVTYGIQPPHYILVESALVRTLELGLADNFTNSLRKDWEAVFRFVSRAMMMGAGNRVEIVKKERRSAEHKKIATLRLNAKRNKGLVRNRRKRFSRLFEEGEPKSRYRRRRSGPPQQPVRTSLDISTRYAVDAEIEHLWWSDPDETEDYWSWGNQTNVEPPRKPQRTGVFDLGSESSLSLPPRKPQRTPDPVLLPPLSLQHGSFDNVSTLSSNESVLLAPKELSMLSPPRNPRRIPDRTELLPLLARKSSFDSDVSTICPNDSAPLTPRRALSPPTLAVL